MAQIEEIHDGDIGATNTSDSESRNYLIRGCKARQEAYDSFFSYIANNFYRVGNRFLSSLNVREDRNDSPVVFYGEATWAWNEQDREVGDEPVYDYSTKGGTAHITFGSSVGRYVKSGKSPILFQGIGPSPGGSNGNYEGCDIVVPAWSATVSVTLSDLVAGNWAFQRLIRNMTGTMNSDVFMGCDPGELLYLGADIKSRYKTNSDGIRYRVWDVTHEFMGAPNASDLLIEGITVAKKYGFDYMSVYYLKGEITEGGGEDEEDGEAPGDSESETDSEEPSESEEEEARKYVIQIARQVNVDRVYRMAGFSALGLPITG